MKHLAFLIVPVVTAAAISLSGTFRPKPTPVQIDERFGVATHFAQGWDLAWTPVMAAAAIAQARDELYWAQVETKKGVFAFPESFDRYMASLARNRISPLIVLSFENPLYDGGDTPHSDEAIAAFARYAVEVLRHYGGQIKAVEVWNEYNGSFARGPATQDRAGTYLRMLRATYTAIKRERPDVLVAGGATAGVPLPYWEKLLSGGALDFMDVLSVHPYRYELPPEGIESAIGALRSLVQKHQAGSAKPIWATEFGWFTKTSTAPGDLAIDDTVQARFLARSAALLISAGVERFYWYLLHDLPGLPMGLFRDDEEHTPKPAATAFTTLLQQLRGARFVRRETTPGSFYSLVFTRPNGEDLRVVWSLTPTTLPTGGMKAVTDLQGRPAPLTDPLHLDDSPIFIQGSPTSLPLATTASVSADSVRDFSSTPDHNGWSYGALLPDAKTLTPLTVFGSTDWVGYWTGDWPYLSVSAGDQHPSYHAGAPVAVVRRWRSNESGRFRLTGHFRSQVAGDGVGVSIAVDGQRRWRKVLGGGNGNPILESFDFFEPVQVGTTIDFIVDPGPAANIDFDATAVAVTLTKEAP